MLHGQVIYITQIIAYHLLSSNVLSLFTWTSLLLLPFTILLYWSNNQPVAGRPPRSLGRACSRHPVNFDEHSAQHCTAKQQLILLCVVVCGTACPDPHGCRECVYYLYVYYVYYVSVFLERVEKEASRSMECFADAWQKPVEVPTVPWALLGIVFFCYLLLSKLQDWEVWYHCKLFWEFLHPVPLIHVPMTMITETTEEDEARKDSNGVSNNKTAPPPPRSLQDPSQPHLIQCYDPATGEYLGAVPAMTPAQVHQACQKAQAAQVRWAQTTWAQRRTVLRTLQKYLVHHVLDICQVSSRDSGKPLVDACLGEVLTTCEKIRTINAHGELWLRPSYRPTGPLLMHKTAVVEYVPLGVIGTIAPWNYPYVCFCKIKQTNKTGSLSWMHCIVSHNVAGSGSSFGVSLLLSLSLYTHTTHYTLHTTLHTQLSQYDESHYFGHFCWQRRGGQGFGAHQLEQCTIYPHHPSRSNPTRPRPRFGANHYRFWQRRSGTGGRRG